MNATKTGKWMDGKCGARECSGDSTHEDNQEGSEGRPLSHKYLRKGPT